MPRNKNTSRKTKGWDAAKNVSESTHSYVSPTAFWPWCEKGWKLTEIPQELSQGRTRFCVLWTSVFSFPGNYPTNACSHVSCLSNCLFDPLAKSLLCETAASLQHLNGLQNLIIRGIWFVLLNFKFTATKSKDSGDKIKAGNETADFSDTLPVQDWDC